MEDEASVKVLPFCFRLASSMASMPNPVKDTKAYNYKYETLNQVVDIVQSKLLEHGLFMTQGVFNAGDRYELRTTIRDVYDPEIAHVMDARPIKFSGDPQKDGSAETYARRYSLKTVFGLCGEDDDGAAASERPKPEQKKAELTEYQLLCNALTEYCDATGEPKGEAWKKFSHGKKGELFTKDMALSKATRLDIEAATKKVRKQ